jgi:hypothetical protein
VIIVVKDDRRRVNDAQATLELNGLQFLRVSRLRCNGAHLHSDAPSKGRDKHSWLKMNAMTHLGTFEGVDQTALADIREADDADGDTCVALGFYTLRRESNAGAVPEPRFVCRC